MPFSQFKHVIPLIAVLTISFAATAQEAAPQEKPRPEALTEQQKAELAIKRQKLSKAAHKSKGKSAYTVGTNIIGTQEAPTVLNVVPWKERQVTLEKKDISSSILQGLLQPLDREEMLREVEYYGLLQDTQE